METGDDTGHFQATTRGTSDDLTNRKNIHYARRCRGIFHDSGTGYKTADLLTYFYTYISANVCFVFYHILSTAALPV